MYVSPEGKAYRALLARLFPKQLPLLGDLVMSATLYRPAASGDLGNRLKVLEDALEGIAYLGVARSPATAMSGVPTKIRGTRGSSSISPARPLARASRSVRPPRPSTWRS
jgi:hypothetical protein